MYPEIVLPDIVLHGHAGISEYTCHLLFKTLL
jgi:hypothetical protein